MLRFKLGSIPVHVHLWFFLMAFMIGGGSGTDMRMLLARAFVVFLAVLLHELGHAWMGRAFGMLPSIELHGMGGTTSWLDDGQRQPFSPWRRILISLAGPLVGIAIGAALLVAGHQGVLDVDDRHAALLEWIIWVNLGWGIFNLVPIMPLDGGNVLAMVLHMISRTRGMAVAHVISLVLAVAGGAYFGLVARSAWMVVLAVIFAVHNVRGLQALRAR